MIANYVSSLLGASIETLRDGSGNVYVKVYNNSGSALSNGAWKALTIDLTATYEVRAVPVTVGTEATCTVVVGVINNAPFGKSTIANGEYGFLQIAGWCAYANTSGTVNEGDQLEVLNTAVAAIDSGANDGAQLIDEAVAIAVKNVTTNVWQVWILGKASAIKAA